MFTWKHHEITEDWLAAHSSSRWTVACQHCSTALLPPCLKLCLVGTWASSLTVIISERQHRQYPFASRSASHGFFKMWDLTRSRETYWPLNFCLCRDSVFPVSLVWSCLLTTMYARIQTNPRLGHVSRTLEATDVWCFIKTEVEHWDFSQHLANVWLRRQSF